MTLPRKNVSELNPSMLYKIFGYNSRSRNEVPLTGATRAAGSEAMLGHAQSMKHCMTPGLGSPVPVLFHPPCADECCRMSLGTGRFQCSSRGVLKGEMNVQGEPASHQQHSMDEISQPLCVSALPHVPPYQPQWYSLYWVVPRSECKQQTLFLPEGQHSQTLKRL